MLDKRNSHFWKTGVLKFLKIYSIIQNNQIIDLNKDIPNTQKFDLSKYDVSYNYVSEKAQNPAFSSIVEASTSNLCHHRRA